MNCDYVCPPWFIFRIVDECGEKLSEVVPYNLIGFLKEKHTDKHN